MRSPESEPQQPRDLSTEEEDERRKAKEARLDALGAEMMAADKAIEEIKTIVDPDLEGTDDRGIEVAKEFVHVLQKSLQEPKDYEGDRTKATGMDKYLHPYWSEHDAVERAFQTSTRIESHVRPAMTSGGKKHYTAEVYFTDKDGKKTSIHATFDEDGTWAGSIGMSRP